MNEYFKNQLGQLKYFYILNGIKDGRVNIEAKSIFPEDIHELERMVFAGYTPSTNPFPRFATVEYIDFNEALSQPKISTKESIKHLVGVMEKDQDYAWAWHCNLAMSFYDAFNDVRDDISHLSQHEIGNRGAANFMTLLFGIDTTKFAEFKDLEEQWNS